MDLGIPPLKIKNLLESNPLKSRFVVHELTVEPFSVVRSCMLMGSTQSGSYVKGVKSTYIKGNFQVTLPLVLVVVERPTADRQASGANLGVPSSRERVVRTTSSGGSGT